MVSLLLQSVAVTASISVEGVAYCAIDIVVCIKAKLQYKGMAGRLLRVLDLPGNDDQVLFLNPCIQGLMMT